MGVFEDMMAQSSRRPGGLAGILEGRSQSTTTTRRSTSSTLTSHLWELELVPPRSLERLTGAIKTLAKNALEPNLFFEAEIVRAAWPRLASLLAPSGCWMLCLWEGAGEGRKLRVFMPVRLGRTGLPSKPVLEVLANEYLPTGTPLVDRENPDEAVETLFRLLADPQLKLPTLFSLPHQRVDGPVMACIDQALTALGLPSAAHRKTQRAALAPKKSPSTFLATSLGKKRLRELNRQWRRLEDTGELSFTVANTQDNLLNAFEQFLTLELHGWKGRRGTALYNHRKVTAFSRQIVVELGTNGGSEIAVLSHNNKPIAVLILLSGDGWFVPWKIAFDEDYRAFSPGMQIMAKVTTHLVGKNSLVMADSLAVEDHWMMNHIWPDRLSMQNVLVGLTPQSQPQVQSAFEASERQDQLKAKLKSLLRIDKLKKR
ncbi:MAG: GNAT family N-acetyltransferase [Pseudomonadota bacterium]